MAAQGLAHSAEPPPDLATAVKATYLYKLPPFVKWPDGAAQREENFRLCVGGRDPFGAVLETAVYGQSIEGREITISRLAIVTGDAACDLLFAAGSPEQPVSQMLAAVAGLPVLTVTDDLQQSKARGVIHFVRIEDNIRFHVNLDSARENRLTISSKLLSLAVEIVDASAVAQDVQRREMDEP